MFMSSLWNILYYKSDEYRVFVLLNRHKYISNRSVDMDLKKNTNKLVFNMATIYALNNSLYS